MTDVRSGDARPRNEASLRPLNLPMRVEVLTDGRGRPHTLGPGRERSGGKRVIQIRESWRIDDEWWRTPIARLYHEVVLEDGAVVTLYRDLVEGFWYLQ